MRAGFRQVLSMVAVIAIALHTVLWAAFPPLAAASAVDSFTVICYSETSAPNELAPGHDPLAPAHAPCSFLSTAV